jgi:hypothetical protein
MHNAPAVGFPVGRSPYYGVLTAVVVLCSLSAMVVWVWQTGGVGWPQWLGLAGSLTTSSWMIWQWWHTPTGFLSWDGEVWAWAVDHQTAIVVPKVELDFQRLLLLRLCSPLGPTRTWVWLESAFAPPRWLALRRAVFDVPRPKTEPMAGSAAQPKSTVVLVP